jgi:hypothetical protein
MEKTVTLKRYGLGFASAPALTGIIQNDRAKVKVP